MKAFVLGWLNDFLTRVLESKVESKFPYGKRENEASEK
jgi:hypothetical protein